MSNPVYEKSIIRNALIEVVRQYALLKILDMVDQYHSFPYRYPPELYVFVIEQGLAVPSVRGFDLTEVGNAVYLRLCNYYSLENPASQIVHFLHKMVERDGHIHLDEKITFYDKVNDEESESETGEESNAPT